MAMEMVRLLLLLDRFELMLDVLRRCVNPVVAPGTEFEGMGRGSWSSIDGWMAVAPKELIDSPDVEKCRRFDASRARGSEPIEPRSRSGEAGTPFSSAGREKRSLLGFATMVDVVENELHEPWGSIRIGGGGNGRSQ